MLTDEYANLSPEMRARLDSAEMTVARLRDWIGLIADRGPQHHLIARELCLLMGWAAPKPAGSK